LKLTACNTQTYGAKVIIVLSIVLVPVAVMYIKQKCCKHYIRLSVRCLCTLHIQF